MSQKMDLSIIQTFAIFFYSHYNHLSEINDLKEKLIAISLLIINNFNNDNILQLLENEIVKLFPENDILSHYKEIDDYVICYALCDLSKNIEMMDYFFKGYLNVSVFDSNELKTLNMENPFCAKLFYSIFTALYPKIKQNKSDNLDSIIDICLEKSNTSLYNISRCDRCYDIMKIKLNEHDDTIIKCDNYDGDDENHIYKESDLL